MLLKIEPGAADELVVGLGGDFASGPDEFRDRGQFAAAEEPGLLDAFEGWLVELGTVAPVDEEGLIGGFLGWEVAGGVVDGPVEVPSDLAGFLAGGEDPAFIVGNAGEVVLFRPADAGAGGAPVDPADGLGQKDPGGAVAGLFQGAAEDDFALLGGDGPLGKLSGGGEADVGDGSLQVGGEIAVFTRRGDADALGGLVPGLGIDGVEQGGILGLLGPEVLEPEIFREDGVLAWGEEGRAVARTRFGFGGLVAHGGDPFDAP